MAAFEGQAYPKLLGPVTIRHSPDEFDGIVLFGTALLATQVPDTMRAAVVLARFKQSRSRSRRDEALEAAEIG